MSNLLWQLKRVRPREWAHLAEAVVALSAAGVLLKVLSFQRLSRRLGHHMAKAPPTADRSALRTAKAIRWAVTAAADRMPWKPVCLPRAVAAHWMLRRRGLASTLYLGLDASKNYDAHAWVRFGRIVVTGGPGEERFVVVSTFA
ncbi:MAG: lasso peptide biosynthesis B2 protein [Gemmatimonadales bacterium]